MTDRPAYTRREFVGTSLAIVSTTATVPAFLHQSALAVAPAPGALTVSRPGVPEDRILVVIELSGGNDGLNTVVPYGAPEYYKARPVLAVRENDVIRLSKSQGLGLHPQMGPLRQMIDDGTAAVIQGVGYPNPNRSHFTSMDIWHTADTTPNQGVGWIGKAMDHTVDPQHTDGTDCVCIGRNTPLATQGKTVKPISFQNANLFRWVGSDLHPLLGDEYDKINRAGIIIAAAGAAPDDQTAFLMRTALNAQIASDRIRNAVAKGPVTRFPGGRLASQLRMVAAMIRAELRTRVYYVSLGGFDTHAAQINSHANNLGEFARGVNAFYAELKAMGQDSRVLTIAFSEFGRRVRQNASNGTDHGTAGPMFIFGDMVRPGLLGEHPSLARLDQGDLIYNVDFRSVYAAVLDHWLKADSTTVLGRRFRPANILSPKALG